jgi:hypothetical protein
MFLLQERHLNAVMFEDAREIQADLRIVAICVAGGKERHLAAIRSGSGLDGRRVAPRTQLLAQSIRSVRRYRRVGVHA